MNNESRAEDVMVKGYRSPLARRVAGGVVAITAALAVGAIAPTTANAATRFEAPQPDPIVVVVAPTPRPTPAPKPAPIRRLSRFGVGSYADECDGNLFVSAPLYMLAGRRGWVPQNAAPVMIQTWTATGWVTAKTVYTNRAGYFAGIVHVGTGYSFTRAVRPTGRTVRGTVSSVRMHILEPCDIN